MTIEDIKQEFRIKGLLHELSLLRETNTRLDNRGYKMEHALRLAINRAEKLMTDMIPKHSGPGIPEILVQITNLSQLTYDTRNTKQ